MNFPTGCLLSPDDSRDYNASSHIPVYGSSGATQDIELPEIEADYQLGDTCVSHSREVRKTQKERIERGYLQRFNPYFLDNTRQPGQYQGTNGWYPREAEANLVKFGICRRDLFDSEPFRGEMRELPKEVLEDAKYQRNEKYFRINTRDEGVSNIKLNGGFSVAIPLYSDFVKLVNTDDTLPFPPILPLPRKGEKPKYYHDMAVQGVKFSLGGWKVLNSHGTHWGKKGYFILPFDYPIEEMWGAKDAYIPIPETATEDIILWIGKKNYQAGGKTSEMDVAPILKPGKTFVPLRFIGQALGFLVEWDVKTKKVTLNDGFTRMNFTIGQNVYFINNEPKFLSLYEEPFIEENRTFVPLRIIGESFGREVRWFEETQKIIIYKKKTR